MNKIKRKLKIIGIVGGWAFIIWVAYLFVMWLGGVIQAQYNTEMQASKNNFADYMNQQLKDYGQYNLPCPTVDYVVSTSTFQFKQDVIYIGDEVEIQDNNPETQTITEYDAPDNLVKTTSCKKNIGSYEQGYLDGIEEADQILNQQQATNY